MDSGSEGSGITGTFQALRLCLSFSQRETAGELRGNSHSFPSEERSCDGQDSLLARVKNADVVYGLEHRGGAAVPPGTIFGRTSWLHSSVTSTINLMTQSCCIMGDSLALMLSFHYYSSFFLLKAYFYMVVVRDIHFECGRLVTLYLCGHFMVMIMFIYSMFVHLQYVLIIVLICLDSKNSDSMIECFMLTFLTRF